MGPGSGFPPAPTPGCLFFLLCRLGYPFFQGCIFSTVPPPHQLPPTCRRFASPPLRCLCSGPGVEEDAVLGDRSCKGFTRIVGLLA